VIMLNTSILIMKVSLLFLFFFGVFLGVVHGESQKVHTIRIQPGSFQFSPDSIRIQTGETVEWVNGDKVEVHFLIDDFLSIPGTQPEIGSKTLEPGDMTQHTFLRPGKFPFQCFFHFQQHGMKGVVIVEGENLDPLPF